MKVGELFDAQIKDLASDGRGVVMHASGRAVFVPGVAPGEKIRCRIDSLKGRVGFASLEEVLEPSNERVIPRCSHHGFGAGECGGCPWQFLDYQAQLAAKQQRLEQSFSRLGVTEIAPIQPSEKIWAYRNRAQFKTDGDALGYVSTGTNRLAPINACVILSETNQATLEALLEELPKAEWKPKKKRTWTTLDIDESTTAKEVLVNQRSPFAQANSDQNLFMREWLKEKLARLPDKSSTRVLELFAGSGNLTEVIAECGFTDIFAADIAGDAIDVLKKRKLNNVHTYSEDLYKDGLAKVAFAAKNANVLVLDPPRDGLPNFGPLLGKKSQLKWIYYISCDLATLCRDVKVLREAGFLIDEVQGLDMFPHTPHIETMVALVRSVKKKNRKIIP